MDVTPLVRADLNIIQSYEGGRFKISGEIYEYPVIVTGSDVTKFPAKDFEVLNADDFDIQNDIDVILLGTGETQKFLSPDTLKTLKEGKNISLEMMDTGAACRTYNVLIAEGRRVAAILL